jgi:hypothetical protein
MLVLAATLTFTLLDVQPRRLPDSAQVLLIQSEEQWSDFVIDSPPAVDFSRYSVVAIFAGERPTGGWSIRIKSVEQTERTCVVSYEVKGPPRGAIVTQAITHPYAVVQVNGKCEGVTGRQTSN